MELTGCRNDKEIAQKLDVSQTNFSNRKKRGSLLSLFTEWAINEDADLNWLLKSKSPSTYINGNSNVVNGQIINGSVSTTSAQTPVCANFKDKLAYMDELKDSKTQGLMTDAQYKKAMDELWGVCNGEHDRKGSNID